MAETGLGIVLEKESVTAEALRDAVSHVLSDPIFRANVQRMQEEARLSGGFHAAVDALQDFVGKSSTRDEKGMKAMPYSPSDLHRE